jgi:hypothetical protein
MSTLSIIRATECTFWASWQTAATPSLLAIIGEREALVAVPMAICGPIRARVNDRTFAVTLFVERIDERSFLVIYQVQTVEELAGADEGMGRLFEVVDAIVEAKPVIADLKIDVTLPATLAWCPGFPRRPDAMGSGIDAAALEFVARSSGPELASSVVIERVGYRFVEGTGGLEEVELVYLHEEDEYTVEIRARAPFQIVLPALVPWAIEELANLVLTRFFRARG